MVGRSGGLAENCSALREMEIEAYVHCGRGNTVRSNYGLPVSLMCPIGRLRGFTCYIAQQRF